MRFAKENWIFSRAGTSIPKSPNYLSTNKFIVKNIFLLRYRQLYFLKFNFHHGKWNVAGWLALASATCMKGLHFSVFTFTWAISYLVLAEVYLHIHQTWESQTTALLYALLFFVFLFYSLERLFMPLCCPLPREDFQPCCCSLDAGGAAWIYVQCSQRHGGTILGVQPGGSSVAPVIPPHPWCSACVQCHLALLKQLCIGIAVPGLNLAGFKCIQEAFPKLLTSPFSSSTFVHPCAVLWHQPSFPRVGQQGPSTWMRCQHALSCWGHWAAAKPRR